MHGSLSLVGCAAVVIPLMWGLAEACEEEGFLIEAENAYKGLSEMHDAFKDDPSIPVSNPLLFSDITLGFAQFLRRQGRLDKARELCDQVISDHRVRTFPLRPHGLPEAMHVWDCIGIYAWKSVQPLRICG